MKLSGREAARFCQTPDLSLCGALLYGADAGLVAARRQELLAALSPDSEAPLSPTRFDPGVLRRDPAELETAMRARGFFAERGAVLIEAATDALAAMIAPALAASTREDSFLLVTAGALPARSALRKLFEGSDRAAALPTFADSPQTGDVARRLVEMGVRSGVRSDADELLRSIGAGMDHGGFSRLLDIVALYAMDLGRELTAEDVAALAPAGVDAELDAFVQAVADGRAQDVATLVRRLGASGASAVGIVLGLQRHFRQLLLAASAGGGSEAGLSAVRPPLWGARRDAFRAQLSRWPRQRLEVALRMLFETDGRLRSSAPSPASAVVERCALRLAMLAGR